MYSATYAPIDPSFVLERLGLHPLLALNANLNDCGIRLECDRDFGAGFVDDIAKGINRAVDAVENYLGYSPYPKFECEKGKYPFDECTHMKQPKTGKFKSVCVRNNLLQQVGRRATELIATVDVKYTDPDGDGLRELATIEYDFGAEPAFDPCELQAFFVGSMGVEAFRIRPNLSVTLDATVATLAYNMWDLIAPSQAQSLVAQLSRAIESVNLCCAYNADDTIDTAQDCPLAATVELRRIYVDTATCPAELAYEGGIDKCGCGSPSCIAETKPACVQETALCNTVRLVPAEQETDANGNATACSPLASCSCVREPDAFKLYYLGGCPEACNDDCYDPDQFCYFDAIYWLTLAWMDYAQCDCNAELNDILLAQSTSTEFEVDGDKYGYSSIVQNNLVGERKAWGILRNAQRMNELCP